MDRADCVIIGAGVVGLAIARALSRSGREVIVLDAADAIGTETSSRNSEVIHAGLYYTPGSLKARLCVDGKARLYRFCEEHGVPFGRCGKLIVATAPGQLPTLAAIMKLGEANGVGDLSIINSSRLQEFEPEITGSGALHSPSTGIVDSHALMLALLGDAESHGAALALRSRMLRGRAMSDGIILAVDAGDGRQTEILTGMLINSAGLGAQAVARSIDGMAADAVPPLHLARGNYFNIAGKSPVSRLVYPVPQPGGLGVHLTIDLAGQARVGPDVEWIDGIDYSVDPGRAAALYDAVRLYWPGLPDGALQPGYAGIRPKVERPGGSGTDFIVQSAQDHGVPGLINLFGIESPGLTASLAIADMVAQLAIQDAAAIP